MKKRLLRFCVIVFSVFFALVSLNACAPKPDVLSDQEISELHKKYAFAETNPAFDISPPEHINDRHLNDIAFVTVTVTENWENEETIQMSPGEGMNLTDVKALFLSVHIDSIFKTVNATTNFETGDRMLHFPVAMMQTGYEYFVPGARFVLAITGDTDCPFEKHPGHYSADVFNSFILTDENRLVSLNEFEFFDRYTGWSLESFSAEMNRLSWPGPLTS